MRQTDTYIKEFAIMPFIEFFIFDITVANAFTIEHDIFCKYNAVRSYLSEIWFFRKNQKTDFWYFDCSS